MKASHQTKGHPQPNLLTPDKPPERPTTPTTLDHRTNLDTKRSRSPTLSPARPAPRVRDYSYGNEEMSEWDKDNADLEETLTQEPETSIREITPRRSSRKTPPTISVAEEEA